MPNIVLVGLNHKVAPIELREKLAFGTTSLVDALRRFGVDNSGNPACGDRVVILSTCNRLEIYTVASSGNSGHAAVCSLLEDCHGENRTSFQPYLYTHTDELAVGHLFSVAAGLDSMVLGEQEILGQVTRAMETALTCGVAGKVLSSLFRHAIEAGKRARTETGISRGTTSVSHVAVELAGKIYGDLCSCRVLLVGAGEMAELAAQGLVECGVADLSILNRTRERAERLASQFGARPLAWEELDLALHWADIVIASTGAPHAIFRRENVGQALRLRRLRPLFFIDIAVPRNVEPAVEGLEGAYRYDIDDLERVVENSLAERRREVPRVEAIVEEVREGFMAWYRSLGVEPTIVDLRRQAHAIREVEVERALRRLPELNDGDREIVQGMARRIVNKVLHHPTVCLKQHASSSNGHEYAEVARTLFGLDGRGDRH